MMQYVVILLNWRLRVVQTIFQNEIDIKMMEPNLSAINDGVHNFVLLQNFGRLVI